jgi:hypothetical protein
MEKSQTQENHFLRRNKKKVVIEYEGNVNSWPHHRPRINTSEREKLNFLQKGIFRKLIKECDSIGEAITFWNECYFPITKLNQIQNSLCSVERKITRKNEFIVN